MYNVVKLDREHDLNKILKHQKKTKNNVKILFYSLWDDWATALVDKVQKKYGANKRGELLYLVDSYSLPHSFVIFNTTKVPHLVSLHKDRVHSEDYLPHIYKDLSV
jgi:hypothetical protein